MRYSQPTLILVISIISLFLRSEEVNYNYTIIAEGLDRPWSLAVIDDENIL